MSNINRHHKNSISNQCSRYHDSTHHTLPHSTGLISKTGNNQVHHNPHHHDHGIHLHNRNNKGVRAHTNGLHSHFNREWYNLHIKLSSSHLGYHPGCHNNGHKQRNNHRRRTSDHSLINHRPQNREQRHVRT